MLFNFTPKAVLSLLIGGACGGGGLMAYDYVEPGTWKEVLGFEGISLLVDIADSDSTKRNNSYKAIFLENKETINTDIAVDSSDEGDAASKIHSWCQAILKEKYTRGEEGATKKQKILKYCENKHPKTVEGVFKRIEKRGLIKENPDIQDEHYKTVFAVYKYNTSFLSEINKIKGDEEEEYTTITEASKGYSRLKDWCENNLKSTFYSLQTTLYSNLLSWCKPLDYSTVIEKINKDYPNWQKESETSTDENKAWGKIKTRWAGQKNIWSVVKSGAENAGVVTVSDYKTWCDTALDRKLHEDSVYQRDYLIAKVVCVQETIQTKLTSTVSLEQALKKE